MKKFYAAFARVVYFFGQPILSILLHNTHRVRILVLAEGKVLLQRTSVGPQEWSLPGGGVERGEEPVAAAVRELKEETGLQVLQKQLVFLEKQYGPTTTHNWPRITRLFYKVELAKIMPVHITRQFEILEVGWFNLDQLPKDHSKTLDAALALSQIASKRR